MLTLQEVVLKKQPAVMAPTYLQGNLPCNSFKQIPQQAKDSSTAAHSCDPASSLIPPPLRCFYVMPSSLTNPLFPASVRSSGVSLLLKSWKQLKAITFLKLSETFCTAFAQLLPRPLALSVDIAVS